MTSHDDAAESVQPERPTLFRTGGEVANGRRLRIVAVSDCALRSELLDALTIHDGHCDDIFVETLSGAYWRIRQVMPDLVIIFMEIDDANACQLMTLLHSDPDLRRIAVETCATGAERASTHIVHGRDADSRYSSLVGETRCA